MATYHTGTPSAAVQALFAMTAVGAADLAAAAVLAAIVAAVVAVALAAVASAAVAALAATVAAVALVVAAVALVVAVMAATGDASKSGAVAVEVDGLRASRLLSGVPRLHPGTRNGSDEAPSMRHPDGPA